MNFDPVDYLKSVGQLSDSDIDLAQAALSLALENHSGVSIGRYHHHLKQLSEDVSARHHALLEEGANDDVQTRLAALKHIIADKYEYHGEQNSSDLQNADLVRVIDRRVGLPIALVILYIHAGRSQGWAIEGLNMPGHFLGMIEQDGQRLIFDAADSCRLMQAQDLRQLIKKILGEDAELNAEYYQPCRNREILIRLQNHIKHRQIEAEDYEGAVQTVETMRFVDPGEFRLLLDAGVLYARLDKPVAAMRALENYIEKAPNDYDRHEAVMLLRDIRKNMD